MNVYDQSARFAAKGDPAGFFRWLLAVPGPSPEFLGWLDTRTLPFPGDPDRTGDTVAELADPAESAARWALATEFQSEPDPDMLDRLLEYLARLRRELRHGPDRRDKYRVVAALVHLTGRRAPDTLDMTLPGDPAIGLRLRVVSRSFRDESAAATLAAIEAGRASRWLLPWIPLMKGARETTIVEHWKTLATAEPDSRSRATFGALALVFVGLTRHAAPWRRGLEGWNMRESPIVSEWKAEWKAEGKAEGIHRSILRVLELRFPGQIPDSLRAAVESQLDEAELSRWLDAAVTAPSLPAFAALTR